MGSNAETDYWPLALYDTREARTRDNLPVANNTLQLSGVMHFIELDVNNLRRWLAGRMAPRAATSVNEDGFVVYFSDRRNNRDAGRLETGEFGWEDFVNPGNANGTPDGLLNAGEDVNSDQMLGDVYGRTPVIQPGSVGPLNNAADPGSVLTMPVRASTGPCYSGGR